MKKTHTRSTSYESDFKVTPVKEPGALVAIRKVNSTIQNTTTESQIIPLTNKPKILPEYLHQVYLSSVVIFVSSAYEIKIVINNFFLLG